uniref:Maturase K n=1 Tax=Parascaris univalens TaxID=6257 RepID=A0A915BH86_PARUN
YFSHREVNNSEAIKQLLLVKCSVEFFISLEHFAFLLSSSHLMRHYYPVYLTSNYYRIKSKSYPTVYLNYVMHFTRYSKRYLRQNEHSRERDSKEKRHLMERNFPSLGIFSLRLH